MRLTTTSSSCITWLPSSSTAGARTCTCALTTLTMIASPAKAALISRGFSIDRIWPLSALCPAVWQSGQTRKTCLTYLCYGLHLWCFNFSLVITMALVFRSGSSALWRAPLPPPLQLCRKKWRRTMRRRGGRFQSVPHNYHLAIDTCIIWGRVKSHLTARTFVLRNRQR